MAVFEMKVYVLKCDHRDRCSERWCGSPGESISQVRAEADRQDWYSDGEKDWCPDHVPS